MLHLSKINKNVFLWGLYDFANTPLTAAMGGLFLAQWIVLDNGIDDIWYGGVFTLATVLLLITSPFLGAWSDKTNRRMPFLKVTTYLLICFGVLLGFAIISPLPKITRVILTLVLFFFVQYFYQISLVFYNALLKPLSTAKTMGKVSGIGQAFGEVGWLLGPALLLPFAGGYITLMGEPGRGQVFFPAVGVLILLGLPMIFWFKETKPKEAVGKVDVRIVYRDSIRGFTSLITEHKNAAIFLISFMFVSDALLTANLYFALFLDQIFKISDFQKYICLSLLEVLAITFAYISGKAGDKYGVKRVLLLSCINLTFVYSVMAFNSSLTLTYILASLVGLGYGGFYTTSRSLLAKISPQNKLGEYFGFYSTFQKFASIIGPLIWGIITLALKDYGVVRYRVAFFALSVLMLIGTLLLLRVREEKDQNHVY